MALTDLFSISFLLSITTIIILIGGIFAYISFRMSQQDHKISSMVSLVSMLAQDLQFIKTKLPQPIPNTDIENIEDVHNLQYPSEMMGGQHTLDLISVSDDEDDEDDEEEDENEEDNDEEDNVPELIDGDDEDDEEDNDATKYNHINLLNLTLMNTNDIEDTNYELKEDTNYELKEDTNYELKEDIKTIHIFENTEIPIIEHQEDKEQEQPFLNQDALFFKNICVNDLTDDNDLPKNEYKKMSLNKLREVIISKGLTDDATKLKKHDILKMLGEEL
jgi:hypothetical protein